MMDSKTNLNNLENSKEINLFIPPPPLLYKKIEEKNNNINNDN
jgi:hypothetical protein